MTLLDGGQQVDFSDEELAELNREFEHLPASKIIQWAVDTFSPHLCMTASMTDAVLIDLAVRVDPGIEVVFIDTAGLRDVARHELVGAAEAHAGHPGRAAPHGPHVVLVEARGLPGLADGERVSGAVSGHRVEGDRARRLRLPDAEQRHAVGDGSPHSRRERFPRAAGPDRHYPPCSSWPPG